MYLTRSVRRKLVATAFVAVGFVFLYEVTTLDSRYAARQAELREASATPAPGARLRFSATAYCKGQTTASGVRVRAGIAAADPDLLPVGSVVQIDGLAEQYNGIYTVMDTGPAVQGRHVDLYMWSCYEALDFGRRPIQLTVVRLGWNPKATGPKLLDRLLNFRRTSRPVESPAPAVTQETLRPAAAPVRPAAAPESARPASVPEAGRPAPVPDLPGAGVPPDPSQPPAVPPSQPPISSAPRPAGSPGQVAVVQDRPAV
jgi:3D (Asp-Asp-Asp) domain-containing protein